MKTFLNTNTFFKMNSRIESKMFSDHDIFKSNINLLIAAWIFSISVIQNVAILCIFLDCLHLHKGNLISIKIAFFCRHKKQKEEDIAICECKFDFSDPDSTCGLGVWPMGISYD